MITRSTPRRAPRAPALLAAAGAAMLFAFGASAGTVQLRDTANLLSPQDEAQLRTEAQRYPFDVRILTTAEHPDRDAFNRYVGAQVASGNMVVVGIDPTHRRTAVHFGNQTRIGTANFPVVEAAGNPSFRQGDWRAGVATILSQANGFVGTGAAAAGPTTTTYAQPGTTAPQRFPQAQPQPQPARRGFPIAGLVIVALVVGGIFLALRAFRRRAAGMAAGGAPGYGQNTPFGGQMQNQGGYGPGYGGPGYGGGRGGSALGGGLMGAGLGGLLGFGLGRATAGHHDDTPAAPPTGGGPVNSGDAGGWDGGGGTSDWGGGGGDGGDGGGGGGGSDW